MKRKLIFLDIDGTLTRPGSNVPPGSALEAIEKARKEVIDLFVTPLVTVLTTMFLTFTVIGPIFSAAEGYILSFAQWLITVGYAPLTGTVIAREEILDETLPPAF